MIGRPARRTARRAEGLTRSRPAVAALLCLGLASSLLGSVTGCVWTPPPMPGTPPPAPLVKPKVDAAVIAARLPQRLQLPCFPCHSTVTFKKGPKFPHDNIGHRDAGHCHRCHVGSMGHGGRQIDRTACLSCHPADAEELQPRAGTSGKTDK